MNTKKSYLIALFILSLSQLYATKNITIKGDFQTDINGITFCVDKRIELLYVIGYLTDYPYINDFCNEYKKDIDAYFQTYKFHKAVKEFHRIGTKVFNSVDKPIRFMLDLTDNLEKLENFKVDFSSDENADSLLMLFKSFYTETNFNKFYYSEKYFYQIILENVKYNFKYFNEKARIEKYYGAKQNSYTIILNILEAIGNFGINIKSPKGSDIYCVIATGETNGNIPVYLNDRITNNLIWHEFSHSFVDPLCEKFSNVINKYSGLYEPISGSMASQFYPNWEVTAKEHIVRAVTCRLAAQKFGEDAAYLLDYRNEFGHRFIYIKALTEKLKEYEKNRDRYKTFDDFFPELLTAFNNIKPEDIDKLQNEVMELRKSDKGSILSKTADSINIVIIIPTHEVDTIAQKSLIDNIKNNKNFLWPDAKIITDNEALHSDLAKVDIVAYGTPWGNLFINKYIQQIPLLITKEKVVAGEEFIGTDYELILNWKNPQNYEKSLTIYTGQKAVDIIGINSIRNDGKSYYVAKNSLVIKIGKLVNFMHVWLCL